MGEQCCNSCGSGTNPNSKVLVHHISIKEELFCHFPYAVFSVALAMVLLSFVSYPRQEQESVVFYRLFHNFHYLHILFAASGTLLMFKRYSDNFWGSLFVGFTIPTLFCTISDAFLPFLGGKMLGLDMKLHWCFIKHLDAVLPFLFCGMINGWVMSLHAHSKQMFYSLGFHFAHIFVSSLASLFYLVSFGLNDWWKKMGLVFIYLVFAVLIPCILSDIVVPIFFARLKFRRNKGV
jgi:hypothetical protein